jgi:hypothetical protein
MICQHGAGPMRNTVARGAASGRHGCVGGESERSWPNHTVNRRLTLKPRIHNSPRLCFSLGKHRRMVLNFLFQLLMALAVMFGLSLLALFVLGVPAILFEQTGSWWWLLLIPLNYGIVGWISKLLDFPRGLKDKGTMNTGLPRYCRNCGQPLVLVGEKCTICDEPDGTF